MHWLMRRSTGSTNTVRDVAIARYNGMTRAERKFLVMTPEGDVEVPVTGRRVAMVVMPERRICLLAVWKGLGLGEGELGAGPTELIERKHLRR